MVEILLFLVHTIQAYMGIRPLVINEHSWMTAMNRSFCERTNLPMATDACSFFWRAVWLEPIARLAKIDGQLLARISATLVGSIAVFTVIILCIMYIYHSPFDLPLLVFLSVLLGASATAVSFLVGMIGTEKKLALLVVVIMVLAILNIQVAFVAISLAALLTGISLVAILILGRKFCPTITIK